MRVDKKLSNKLVCTRAYPHAMGPWQARQEKRVQALQRRTGRRRADVGRSRPERCDERSTSAWFRLDDMRNACLALNDRGRPSRSRGMHEREWSRFFIQFGFHMRRRLARPPASVAPHRLVAWGYDESPF
jgi:hypothetical protein